METTRVPPPRRIPWERGAPHPPCRQMQVRSLAIPARVQGGGRGLFPEPSRESAPPRLRSCEKTRLACTCTNTCTSTVFHFLLHVRLHPDLLPVDSFTAYAPPQGGRSGISGPPLPCRRRGRRPSRRRRNRRRNLQPPRSKPCRFRREVSFLQSRPRSP